MEEICASRIFQEEIALPQHLSFAVMTASTQGISKSLGLASAKAVLPMACTVSHQFCRLRNRMISGG